MAYNAVVLRVMIASPSDVPEARDAVEKAIHDWNRTYARGKGIILQPWRWETSAVPVLGGHPQKLINAQGVDDSDIVFALFGGRLGSPTPDGVSGTAEEVDRAQGLGKPVHLYFSTAPVPFDEIDPLQLTAVREFRQEMRNRGILGEFNAPEQLSQAVWRAIEHDIATLDLSAPTAPAARTGVDFLVQSRQEREQNGVTPKGAPKYRTRHWIEVTNRGGRDAQEVVFEATGEGMFLLSRPEPTTIQHDAMRRVPIEYSMGSSNPGLRIRWTEDGQTQEREFSI